MMNFREVNEDDILKEWYDCMESTYLCYTNEQDKEHEFKYDPFREKILKNVSKQNKKFVEICIKNKKQNNFVKFITLIILFFFCYILFIFY